MTNTKVELNSGNLIHCRLNGKFILQALLDTGAGISFINEQFARQQKLRIQPPIDSFNVVLADGKRVKSIGFTEATISVGDLQFPVTLHVLKDLTATVLLGLDFFN